MSETRDRLSSEIKLENLDKDVIANILRFHQYLCQHSLNLLDYKSYSQQVRERIIAHTLRHLQRMGDTFQRFLDG